MKIGLSDWVAAAKRGEPVWLTDVRSASAVMPGAAHVTARLQRLDGNRLDFSVPIPRWNTKAERRFAAEYLQACVFNILSVHSGRRMEFLVDKEDRDVRALLLTLPETFQLERRCRTGYGKVISIANRLCRMFGCEDFTFDQDRLILEPPEKAAAPVSGLAERLLAAVEKAEKGLVCGLDIGGTDVKVVLVEDGRLLDVQILDWNPASSRTAEGVINPILRFVGSVLQERAPGKRLDGLGVSFPDVVIRDRIVGGETPKTQGMREFAPDYESEFAKLMLLKERMASLCMPGAPIRIINDGHMAAFTMAVELACGGREDMLSDGIIAHSLGTDLGTGWLEPDGTVPEEPMELYDLLLDMGSYPDRALPAGDLRSVCNENSGLPGVRRYVGQSAAFRLAWRLGPALLDGFTVQREGRLSIREQPDMRKPCLSRLTALAAEGDPAAREIFRQIGRNFGQTVREMEWLLQPRTAVRYLFGRFIVEPTCFECIREGCAGVAPQILLEAADESSAYSPLMRQLAACTGVTVAQFGQAVGAAYFSNM